MAAVFRHEGGALFDGDRLQPHRISGQVLSEGNELVPQHREDKNEKKDARQDENGENEKRGAEAAEAESLKFEHDRVKEIAKNDAGREWRYY